MAGPPQNGGTTASVALTAVALTVLDIEVAEDLFGWWIYSNMGGIIWYLATLLFYLAGTIILVRMYRSEQGQDVKRRIVPLALGMAVPVVMASMVAFTLANDQSDPSMLSLIVLLSCLCIGFGVIRQRLFIIEPVKEDVQGFGHVPAVRPGHSVLVEAKAGDLAYRMFISDLASGGQGLLIARMHPDQIRERYGLRNTPILWLTTKSGPDNVDPARINLLLHSAVSFLHREGGSIVLLDGLEYLQTYNSPEAVMQFIYSLTDAVMVSGSKLIVAVDPEALGQWDLPRLERELESIRA